MSSKSHIHPILDLEYLRSAKLVMAKKLIEQAEEDNPPRPMTDYECEQFDAFVKQIRKIDSKLRRIKSILN